jgi:hypothetical protein
LVRAQLRELWLGKQIAALSVGQHWFRQDRRAHLQCLSVWPAGARGGTNAPVMNAIAIRDGFVESQLL